VDAEPFEHGLELTHVLSRLTRTTRASPFAMARFRVTNSPRIRPLLKLTPERAEGNADNTRDPIGAGHRARIGRLVVKEGASARKRGDDLVELERVLEVTVDD
jgi:hypothetical protein